MSVTLKDNIKALESSMHKIISDNADKLMVELLKAEWKAAQTSIKDFGFPPAMPESNDEIEESA